MQAERSADYEPVAEDKLLESQQTPAQTRKPLLKKLLIGAVVLVVIIALVVGLSVGLTRPKATSQSTATIPANSQNCIEKYDPEVDYFPETLDLYVPNPNFVVKYFKNYKVITNTLNANIETIVLYQCGTPKPELKDVVANLTIEIPIKSIFVGDTTSISFLELLGVRNTIKVTDSLQYTSSPCLLQANATGFGPITVDGYVDAAKALEEAQKVDLSLDYLDSNTAKADNYVTFPASADLSAYNRISWLGFLAAFYNLETKANTIMKTMADNYNCIKSKQSKIENKKTIAWIEFLPAQEYTLNTTVYVLNRWPVYNQYTLDAGASNVTVSLDTINSLANVTLAEAIGTPFRSYFSNRTAFLEAIKDVDIVIDETYFFVTPTTSAEVLATYEWTATDNFKFIQNKNVWRNDKRKSAGGSDWFESAVVSANLVLNDLALIVDGKTEGFTYFRNIYNEGSDLVVITPDMCGKEGADALTVSGLGTAFGNGVKVVECSA